jgi:hypothetical protein
LDKTKKQIETLFTMAKDRGLSPMWSHYYRTNKKGFRVLGATSCILLNADLKPVSRGVSVVSVRDNGAKAYGRLLSLKRAFRVIASEKVDTTVVISTRNVEGILGSYQKKQERLDPADWESYVTELEYDRVVSKVKRDSKIKLEAYQASTRTMTV